MNLPITVTQDDLLEILLNVAPSRPVFIWGAPGIGKSALVEQFASEIGLPCVSLLGSQLAPEDIIGIPQIKGETSEFLPPKMIARKEPYVLFLDDSMPVPRKFRKLSILLFTKEESANITSRKAALSLVLETEFRTLPLSKPCLLP